MNKREAWRAAVHGVAKSWTQLSDWTTTIINEKAYWEKIVCVCMSNAHVTPRLCKELFTYSAKAQEKKKGGGGGYFPSG